MDRISSSEVHVFRCDVAQGLVIALGVVVVDESLDLRLQFPGRLPDDEVDAFLAGTMVAFNLPVGLRMIGEARICPILAEDIQTDLNRTRSVYSALTVTLPLLVQSNSISMTRARSDLEVDLLKGGTQIIESLHDDTFRC